MSNNEYKEMVISKEVAMNTLIFLYKHGLSCPSVSPVTASSAAEFAGFYSNKIADLSICFYLLLPFSQLSASLPSSSISLMFLSVGLKLRAMRGQFNSFIRGLIFVEKKKIQKQ